MKNLKCFKIMLKYLKKDKFKLWVYVFLTFTSYFQTLIYPFIWAKAIESLLIKDWNNFVIYLVFWDGISILFNCILQYPREYLLNYLEVKFMKNVSKYLYMKMQDLPSVAFEEIGVGEYTNRLYQDPDRIIELFSKLIRLVSRISSVVFVIIIAFTVSVYIGLELILFGIVMFIFSSIFFPKIKKIQENVKKESDEYVKRITQNISGIREIKALGIKNIIKNKINKNVDGLFKEQQKIRNTEIVYYNINNLCYFILQFIILLTCGYLYYKGQIEFASFIMIEMYIWRVDDAVQSISEFGVSYNKVVVSLKRIDEIVSNKLYDDEKFGNVKLENVKGIIEFKDVKFRYKNEDDYTLTDFNIKIPAKKKIAIVGKSGMGKTTLFNVLLRYFDVEEGNVLIDGVNIKELTEDSLRDNISVIRQNPYLFNQTILENFRMVKEDVTLEEIKEVCKKAYIDEYIESLPDKYDTLIGEGGVNLSGGQKQRIAIARTLLKNTKIILFDEATSALDNSSQEYIKKTIDDLVKDHTIIIVAHRLSTIMDADIIYVIDEGKVKEYGTHKELMENGEVYKSLYAPEILELDF